MEDALIFQSLMCNYASQYKHVLEVRNKFKSNYLPQNCPACFSVACSKDAIVKIKPNQALTSQQSLFS